jgi:hypothetical protein
VATLTGCMKKAGDLLHPQDKAAMLDRVRELRGAGVKNAEASRQALQERLEHVRSSLRRPPPASRPSTRASAAASRSATGAR